MLNQISTTTNSHIPMHKGNNSQMKRKYMKFIAVLGSQLYPNPEQFLFLISFLSMIIQLHKKRHLQAIKV